MSLRLKFILLFSLMVITISVSIVGIILFSTIEQMEQDANKQFKDNLVVKRTLVAQEIESYFNIISKQIVTMAFNDTAKQAVKKFSRGFNQQQGIKPSAALIDYYNNEYKKVFDQQNDTPVNANGLLESLSPKAAAFQEQYIANNIYPLGEKHKLNVGDNMNVYNIAHNQYHPSFRKFLTEFGFYDIFIVEPDDGHIVYSVFKELDYATSLKTGPYKNSGIAEAFNAATKLKAGEFYLTDFAPYLPSYDASASFISSPIYQGGKLLGVLIFQMPIETINQIMTHDQHWVTTGFGESGETYLVGEDGTLRSESRFFLEDKKSYFDILKERGVNAWRDIEKRDTSVALQPVDSIGAKQALSGKAGFERFEDYRGVEVLSAFAPVYVGSSNINWAIMSEIDVEEAYRGVNVLIDDITYKSIWIIIVVTVLAILLAVLMANYLINPLSVLSRRVAQLSGGEADLTMTVKSSNIPEIDQVSDGVNHFIKKMHTLVSEIKMTIDVFAASGTELGVTTEQTSNSISLQSDSTEQVVESITTLGASIDGIMQETKSTFLATENANSIAQQSAEKAHTVSQDIQKLSDKVQASAFSIKDLQTSVEDISDVLNVINSIADQTNLLALNAAIEAARAGEHGRGFSVVADEVRTLASKTQESTVTIQSQIEQLTSATGKAVQSMELASSSATDSIESVQFVSSSLSELSVVVGEIENMNHGISSQSETQHDLIEVITERMHSLQGSAFEISQASTNINGVAGELAEVADGLRNKTAEFTV